MNFQLIDKVIKLELGKSAEAVKCWSLDNEIFAHHFPGNPVVPGVLITESVAQTMGILIEESYSNEMKTESAVYPVLGMIHKAKFREFVVPGDQTIIKVELDSLDYGRAKGSGSVYVDDQLKMETQLSFIIAYDSDVEANPYLIRREEFKHNILKGIRK